MSLFGFISRNKNTEEDSKLDYKPIQMTPALLQRRYEEESYKKYEVRKMHYCETFKLNNHSIIEKNENLG